VTIRKKIFYLLVLLLSIALSIKINYNIFISDEQQYHKKIIDELKIGYDFILESNRKTAKQFFCNSIEQPEILEIFAKATSGDEKVKNKCRKELYNKLIKSYNRVKSRGVRQLHFHLPNSESFLRFHRVQRFGDNLTGVRYSVDKANRELVEVSGFEEGRIFNGFRNVFPIIYKGKHLGSVEISMSFSSISNTMEKMLRSKTNFIIRKKLVEQKVFESEKKNYNQTIFSDDYLCDKCIVHDSIVAKLNKLIKNEVISQLDDNRSFVLHKRVDENIYHIIIAQF